MKHGPQDSSLDISFFTPTLSAVTTSTYFKKLDPKSCSWVFFFFLRKKKTFCFKLSKERRDIQAKIISDVWSHSLKTQREQKSAWKPGAIRRGADYCCAYLQGGGKVEKQYSSETEPAPQRAAPQCKEPAGRLKKQMAQWLRALIQETQSPLLASTGTTCTWCTDEHTGKILISVKTKINKIK